ncbi:MAG: hypothetical protein RSE18_00965 [Acinetobacter sp.]
MDILEKRKLAHEIAKTIVSANVKAISANDLIKTAWEYADEMEAEENKRKPNGIPEVLQNDQ